MADKQNSAVIFAQRCLATGLAFRCRGRFVGSSSTRTLLFTRHQAGKQQARFLAARERAHRCAGLSLVKEELFEVAYHVFWRAAHHDLIGFARGTEHRVGRRGFPKASCSGPRRHALWSKTAISRFVPSLTTPSSGATKPSNILRTVVFPTPLGPTKATRSPRLMVMSKFLTILLAVVGFVQANSLDEPFCQR